MYVIYDNGVSRGEMGRGDWSDWQNETSGPIRVGIVVSRSHCNTSASSLSHSHPTSSMSWGKFYKFSEPQISILFYFLIPFKQLNPLRMLKYFKVMPKIKKINFREAVLFLYDCAFILSGTLKLYDLIILMVSRN
jgi:hypothetical protein